ncbi:MAG: PAS domain S-box protein [Dehalococcoidia bacterium]|nr:PAS domain S-box protein [Dehalococcoidia bacterium]
MRNLHFLAISGLTLLLAAIYYWHYLGLPALFPVASDFLSTQSLHEFQRMLFLIPMLYAGLTFRVPGALVLSAIVAVIVLPRALLISENPDALARSLGFITLASLATVVVGLGEARRRRVKEAYSELDAAHSQLNAGARELRLSEESYRDLFECASDAILVCASSGDIVRCNRAMVDMLGYSADELLRMNLSVLIGVENKEAVADRQGEWIRTGKRVREKFLRKDGTGVRVDLAARAMTSGRSQLIQIIARDITEEARLRENMEFYIGKITQAQEEERRRIARELHDETAQGLALLAMDIEGIEARLTGSPEVLPSLERLRAKAESLMEGVSRFSHELRPGVLDHLGLVPALEWLSGEMSATFGIPAAFQVSGSERRLSPEVELVLFRIVQEALSNVRRHSGATRASVEIEFGADRIRLQISDNGRGFELPPMLGDLALTGKLGLLGMQERARLIGAAFTVRSGAGKGTSVSVEIAG